jgi:primosomal protein N' (replication factor Y) (superfamily II helicase)
MAAGPGSLVRVPFATRHLQGVICSLEETCDLPRVRDVEELLDSIPVVTPHQLRLARWIAEYYRAPISDVIGAMLPPGLGRRTVYVLEPGKESLGARLTPGQDAVLDAVRNAGRIPFDDVQRLLPEVDVDKAVLSLVRRELVHRSSELEPPRVAPRVERLVTLTALGKASAAGDFNTVSRAPRQREVLEQLVARDSIGSVELGHLIPGASAAVAALFKKGLIELEERQVMRSPLHGQRIPATDPLRLSAAQRTACGVIEESLRAHRADVYLLHGVTGSGKTEVYLQAVAATILLERQAIVMVPEISLTPQAVERFAGRFPGRVAVLHSRLSPGERLDEWQRIRRGEADVIVGPRSALFAPVPRPGLLVVDEEHDPSYKQDSSPRYHARDSAAVLGRISGATVVLGSATPDVGTYHAAQSRRIRLLELPDRPVWETTGKSRPMPPVEVVDMRQELKAGNRGMFSEVLARELGRTLEDEHQALLFLNRRGSSTVVLCRDCGFVVRCPNCEIPFTYHAAATRLICHRCDKREPSPATCPGCGGVRIRYLGVGTQKVEEEVARQFPQARVARWDRDVTAGKDAHEKILRHFARHEADVLVGTQMIAKGLDFPLVTLVGVISADTGLHLPDFRAPERSFQLLTQVAGRAGRATLPSRVVVQTYTPDHYAIQAAKDHDFHRFFGEEMSFRKSAHYPPAARLVRLVYSSESYDACRDAATVLRADLERAIAGVGMDGVEVIGPAPCFVARMKNRYYWQLLARASPAQGSQQLHALLDSVPPGWVIDVDPVDLL